MKSALPLTLVALALFACGGGSSSTSKSSSPDTKSTADAKAGKHASGSDPAGADSETAGVNELMQVLDNLPTQDELDAAAAARISEATADSEYEKLKAEIEADLVKQTEGG